MNDYFDDRERVIEPVLEDGDSENFNTLRPLSLDEFIGQESIKDNLSVSIQAAKIRRETLDHILLYGPPGLGKTTLAQIIAREMGVNIKVTSGPAIEKPGDLAALLTTLGEGDILFIDEIHRLNRQVEEVLYPALEDYVLDIIIGKGPAARSIRIDLKHFTLIGATTRKGMLSAPLRDRFGIVLKMDLYTPKELSQIVDRSAGILNVPITDEAAAFEIGKRARGTPRIANRLLKRVRDYSQVKCDGTLSRSIVNDALVSMGIDELGLDNLDRRLLKAVIMNFAGGPVGIDTLAAMLGEDADTLEDVCEPYLMQIGFLGRTTRGRIATPAAYKHMNIEMPENGNGQMSMFSDNNE